ncbi:hypothetical protein EDD29_3963 [Actinocorallia herbida]|uniref:Uncharacterized protein n=1 Tax=Actinocorallia herbida TaxID=58109 RepID=A0A3N1CYN7_9ACTN|nr:hypothetical protein [Actinocorallia herbida]ROO86397.1 hypothetical protein EDD29_3963 [Actinocorallia herbida]
MRWVHDRYRKPAARAFAEATAAPSFLFDLGPEQGIIHDFVMPKAQRDTAAARAAIAQATAFLSDVLHTR